MGKRKKHVQGRRGETFLRLIRGVARDRILSVDIDVHKYYHKVMVHNDYGEIVVPSFRIDIFESGFEVICATIDETVRRTDAEVVLIGMEPTGHYYENLARHLKQRYPHVRLVNSYAVAQNRTQRMLQRQKTDEIDLSAIGDLNLRNECFPYQPLTGEYLRLQHWVRFREAKVKARTALRNQIIGHLDRIFPGLVRPKKEAQGTHPQLFGDFWGCQTAQDLIRLCPDPRRLAGMEPCELIELFHAQGRRMGPKTAGRIIHFAQQVLLPDPELVAARLPQLELDLDLLGGLDQVIAQAEAHITECLKQTKGQILTHIKGIGTIRAAAYVAGIGNPEHYEHAGQTFRRSGLVSGRNDSGIRQRGGEDCHITKVGDPHLRRALIDIAYGLCQWQPYFSAYRDRLEARGKHRHVANVATARKANGVLFALMRDQTLFEPVDHQGRPVPPRRSMRKATTGIGPSKADA
jgi:transposase